jgi:hypothetical protein
MGFAGLMGCNQAKFVGQPSVNVRLLHITMENGPSIGDLNHDLPL